MRYTPSGQDPFVIVLSVTSHLSPHTSCFQAETSLFLNSINPSSTATDMSDPTDDHHQHLPANPEDRKAAAALSSLNDDLGSRGPTADQEALGKAMSRLEIAAGQGGHIGGNATASAGQTKTEPQVQVKVAKVKAGDVNLLVGASVRALYRTWFH